jgi:signal transduction histidine kinase/DNA-binding response OmpR family regulator
MNPKTETVLPLHRFLGQQQPIDIPMQEEIIVLHNIRGKIWVGTPNIGYLYDGAWNVVYKPIQKTKPCDYWWPSKLGVWSVITASKIVSLENSVGEKLYSVPYKGHIWVDDQLNLWSASTDKNNLYQQLTVEHDKMLVYHTNDLPLFPWINETINTKSVLSPLRYGYCWNVQPPLSDLFVGRSDGSGMINFSREFPGISSSRTFFFDQEGGIWTATNNKIIHLIVNQFTGFQTFLSDESLDRSIRGMIQVDNLLYVNSYKGDCRINLDHLTVSAFDIIKGQGLCFLSDQNGLWVGGHGGIIARIEPGKPATWFPFEHKPDINNFLKCPTRILVGTSNGLFKINTVNRSIEPLPLKDVGISYLYQNKKGIWACTTNGLYLIDEHGHTLAHYLPPGDLVQYEQIAHLAEDKGDVFWLATRGGGLIKWSAEAGIIRKYTTSDGLSNNDIHAVYDDHLGYLWLPSNYGLMRLHKESGRIQVFFKRNGIADDEFNSFSHFQSADGQLFLGGINGITVFYPKDISPAEVQHTHSLRLMEARTFQIKSGGYLNHLMEIEAGRPILVMPEDDYLDIKVSPLVYEDVNPIKYSWKLDGYSDNWVQQQSPNIRLYNLPYGEQKLHIRYILQGNVWSENELFIPIVVSKPFYLRWPFLTLMVVLLLGIAWGIGHWKAQKLRATNLQLEQKVTERTRQIETDKAVIELQAHELRSLDEVKSRFFANITHELRTPLTLILGPSESLQKTDLSKEKAREYIQTILRNASKLLNLVDELLDLSRMDANKLAVNEKPLWLHQFLTRILTVFSPYAEYRGVHLNLIYNISTDVILLLDTQKWEKIINNLLNNALKFTPGGGRVTLTVDIYSSDLVISVEDTGSGIHPDDLPYIFDRYYQSRNPASNLQGGAGIGLSLCREYIRLFGGDIAVESTLDEGSKFTLWCPQKIVTEIQPNDSISDTFYQDTASAAIAPTTRNPKKRTLLLVEDDKDMSDYIQSILSSEYNLLVADNGKKALHILEKNPVDMVLSDVMMPEMDGFQLLKSVRDRFLDLPFIMLTARVDTPDRLAALTMGVDDYLTKPFLEEELTTRLKNLIGRYDTRKIVQAQTDIADIDSNFDPTWLKHLEMIVLENISNPDFSLDNLAENLKISRRSLYNKTVAHTGMRPNQYLTEVRLNEARRLLESKGFKTISEVCYAVGMKTPDYFSKLMKDRFGKMPG